MKDGRIIEVDARFPRPVATMYLDWRGEWHLPPLNGLASAPLLSADGTIHSELGYDPTSGMWREDVPDLTDLIPDRPTRGDAEAALLVVRNTFTTFCFADAETVVDATTGISVVDATKPPGKDELAFLTALLTAVCRPSLPLAPGILIRAAAISGAGAGKGLLARSISIIAFGHEPHAVTGGSNAEELEKRIAAELMGGGSALFLDNLNNTAFRSDLLASAITERPARVRLLGRSQMVPLNSSALVMLTGNGLTITEDLARRFLTVELDPRTENPEARPFATDIRVEVREKRSQLLGALLTIWRWGRRTSDLMRGKPLGSFDQWCSWVRDPLLTLGCQDPAERVAEAKDRDGRRQTLVVLFGAWWAKHGDQPVTIGTLDENVKLVADPQGRGRQFLTAYLERFVGARMSGFVLTRQAAAGKWGAATFALKPTVQIDHADLRDHRDHRGHRSGGDGVRAADTGDSKPGDNAVGAHLTPMPPMPPMPPGRPFTPTATNRASDRRDPVDDADARERQQSGFGQDPMVEDVI